MDELGQARTAADLPTAGDEEVDRCALAGQRGRDGREDPSRATDPHEAFPAGFFDRQDPSDDADFYAPPRLVTHIDEGAIAAVGALYEELAVDGDVLDLMGSWISHFAAAPASLHVLGMNAAELEANPMATATTIHDLNAEPTLPFSDGSFDDAVCCVSIDYLVRPIDVIGDLARLLRPGGRFVCTFSNRCFPTKAIRGWLANTDNGRAALVAEYFRLAGGWNDAVVQRRTPLGHRGDPLFAVWAERA
ncbi:MAG: methyltransferase domain-containing protein [Acidimicrobiales bacterium]|nr:methyltransferase domain-containing protein [Acidimicrobiales bacterium]